MLPKPLLIKYEAFIKKIIGSDHTHNGNKSSALQNLDFFFPFKEHIANQKANCMWDSTFFINVMALSTGLDKAPGAENHKEKSKLFAFRGSSGLSDASRV